MYIKFIFICFLFLSFSAIAQNKIILKNGHILEHASIKEQHLSVVSYEQNGISHDLEISEIKYVEKETNEKWFFVNMELVSESAMNVKSSPAADPGIPSSEIPSPDAIVNSNRVSKDSIINTSHGIVHITPNSISSEKTSIVHTSHGDVAIRPAPIAPDAGDMAHASADDIYYMGIADGEKYFRAPLLTVGGIASGFLIFPYTILPALIGTCVSIGSEPNISGYIPPAMQNNRDYINGFAKGAQKKKLSNALSGFFAALGVSLLVVFAAILILASTGDD